MRSILVLTALLLSLTANAASVTWTVDSLLFSDGGSAYGSFDYDSSTNLYSEINITTLRSDGGGFANYQSLIPSVPSNDERLFLVGPGAGGLTGVAFLFDSGLTNTGGTVAIISGEEVFCEDYECLQPAGKIRDVVSGSISAVPVPAAVWLFGSALAALGWLRPKPTA
jgi:hypothetical protein